MRFPLSRLGVPVLVVSVAVGAGAGDQPIRGDLLTIKTDDAGSQIVFKSTDASALFPGLGDDPVVNGATVEIIPATASGLSLALPAVAGKPGWTAKTTGAPSFTFVNASAPAGISVVKRATWKQGKHVKLLAKQGLPAPVAMQRVAVRITAGATRNCALFEGAAIVRDQSGLFVARKAPAPAIADCSDASLGVPNCAIGPAPACGGHCFGDGVCTAAGSSCRCISPSAPCGETWPTCNGVCPPGEECLDGTALYDGCGCVPAGSTPCAVTAFPACGGSCVAGQDCQLWGFDCTCFPNGGCACPSGFSCYVSPPVFGCEPFECAGTYPTCGGSCGDGGVCRPAISGPGGSTTSCVCAEPGPCDATCGGMDCPAGQVCQVSASFGACGCVTP